MSLPIAAFVERCTSKKLVKEENMDRMTNSLLVIDALIFLTTLVVGILALTAAVTMPPAVGYSLITVSVTISLLWIGLIVLANMPIKSR